jgi:hypothetical protein
VWQNHAITGTALFGSFNEFSLNYSSLPWQTAKKK